MSLYLEGTLPWLLDPESPELATLARETDRRTPSTRCDPSAVAADTRCLRQLLRERHFGVATGRVDLPEVSLPHAERWGDLASAQDELRVALVDEHFRFYGTP